jgi:hypothetical protein
LEKKLAGFQFVTHPGSQENPLHEKSSAEMAAKNKKQGRNYLRKGHQQSPWKKF